MIILASQSPRRHQLLSDAGIQFRVVVPDVDETMDESLPVDQRVLEIANKKATVVKEQHPEDIVLAADTVVVVGNMFLGKPVSKEEARHMLGLLSGNTHEVKTAVVILRDQPIEFVETSFVTFRHLTTEDMDQYIASGEWEGKAGAYAIQGLAGQFVSTLEGSFTNVMGLPIEQIKGLI